jgi:hypothetical protein
MPQFTVGCWVANCRGTFAVDCRDGNQVLHCRTCSQIADFVNLGAVRCDRCGRWKRLSLRFGHPQVDGLRCDQCWAEVQAGVAVRVFSLDEFKQDLGYPGGLSYCGASHFEGYSEEVVIARDALARLASGRTGWRAFGRWPPAPKKAMFIRRLAPLLVSNPALPVQYLQCYHAYCNFQLNLGHENAKFDGTLGAYASAEEIFRRLLDKGLSEIWFGDQLTKREFKLLPTARHARIFRLA